VKAIGYVRVSTEEQAKHGISLDMQRSKIRTYASLEGLELVEIIADEGISGCSIKGRPVIIYKLDRLARNTVEALQIARLMHRNGVALHSITEKLDTKSALGKFFFTLMASIAEMERGIISERIQAALQRKRERGEAFNNNPEYGQRIIDGRVVADLAEQKTIQVIRKLRSEGKTLHGIIEILNKEKIFNRRGRPFGKTQVHSIVRRKVA